MTDFTISSTAPDAYILVFPYKKRRTQMGEAFSPEYLETDTVFIRSELLSVQTSKSKGAKGVWSATIAPRNDLDWKEKIRPGDWCMIFISDEDLGSKRGSETRTESANLNNGPESGFKMLGNVRSVRVIEAVDPGTGIKSLRYQLSGDDFHSALESQAYINPFLVPKGDPETNPLRDSLLRYKKIYLNSTPPQEVINDQLDLMLGVQSGLENAITPSGGQAGGVLAIPPAVAGRLGVAPKDNENNLFSNVLKRRFQSVLLGRLVFQPELSSSFTLWSMIEAFANRVLNEVYTDLIPDVGLDGQTRLMPSIVFRAIPFTSPDFKYVHRGQEQNYEASYLQILQNSNLTINSDTSLYTSRKVTEGEIFAINYGKSDAERFNYFYVASNFSSEKGLDAIEMAKLLGDETNVNSQSPMGDANSIARYGLRPYITSSKYLMNDKKNEPAQDNFVACNLLVRDMWHEAHRYDNGQLQIVGTKTHIPVGTNIELIDRGWLAHVEEVSHSYAVQPNGVKTFRTNISFVRLQDKETGLPIDEVSGAGTRSFMHNITNVEKNDGKS